MTGLFLPVAASPPDPRTEQVALCGFSLLSRDNKGARMGTHLTERIVKAAEIGTRKYVVFDEDCAGFGL